MLRVERQCGYSRLAATSGLRPWALSSDERDDLTDDNYPSNEVKGEYECDPCVRRPALFVSLTELVRQVTEIGYGVTPSLTRIEILVL